MKLIFAQLFFLAVFQQIANAEEMGSSQKPTVLQNMIEVCDSEQISSQTKVSCKIAGALAYQLGDIRSAGRYYMKSCILGYTEGCNIVAQELYMAANKKDAPPASQGFADAIAERACFLGSAEMCEIATFMLLISKSHTAAKLVMDQGCALGSAQSCKEKLLMATPNGAQAILTSRLQSVMKQADPRK